MEESSAHLIHRTLAASAAILVRPQAQRQRRDTIPAQAIGLGARR
ncbi:hypothetical protein ACFPT7_15455 [Acidicapsa dinghuensis]|uniref:Uncharacterized protein n=1 Tax=Acidicapsa dinghuensis TaxID=2218256 RepID=A0ABW1EHX7_9BACT|nr:hypothetical protein [Acidicapsa dinghuensis]